MFQPPDPHGHSVDFAQEQTADLQVTTPANKVKASPHLCPQRQMPLPRTPLGGERVSRVEWASKVEPDGVSRHLAELGDFRANEETQRVAVAASASGWVSTPGESTEDELSATDSKFGDPKVVLPPPAEAEACFLADSLHDSGLERASTGRQLACGSGIPYFDAASTSGTITCSQT